MLYKDLQTLIRLPEKYSNSLLVTWHSVLPLISETNLGIATLVIQKCLWVGSWYLGLDFCSIAQNPGLSTVEYTKHFSH